MKKGLFIFCMVFLGLLFDCSLILAANGWYLIEAPTKQHTKGLSPDLSIPLNRWIPVSGGSFDTAKECNKQRIRNLSSSVVIDAGAKLETEFERKSGHTVSAFEQLGMSLDELTDAVEQYLSGEDKSRIPPSLMHYVPEVALDLMPGLMCIASDDPRLK
jgi:hypothetical protein